MDYLEWKLNGMEEVRVDKLKDSKQYTILPLYLVMSNRSFPPQFTQTLLEDSGNITFTFNVLVSERRR